MRNVYSPLEDRVIVKEIKSKEPQKTEAGILTDTMKKLTKEAEVVSVGPGRFAFETGVFIQTVVHRGDVVLIGEQGGLPIVIEEEDGQKHDCILLREGDILSVIEKVVDKE